MLFHLFADSSLFLRLLYSIYFTNNNNGWAVGFEGTILKTTDGGTNWSFQTSGTTEWLNSVHFADSDTGWTVGLFGKILNTTDGGTNWITQTSGTSAWLRSVHFEDNNKGWAVGGGGFGYPAPPSIILNTTDGGENWNSQTSGTFATLSSVHFTDNNTGWAVGSGGTILHTTNGGVSFIEEEEIDEIPTNYILSQNYPNPFNPSTKIRYSVPQSSQVVIKVFDILGREIETLVNEEKLAGEYEIEFNASELGSGVYFYKLQAGSFVETKKMILLK